MNIEEVCVVLSFFSPAGYELPKRHLHACVQTMHAQGIPLVVTQAVLPTQEPQWIPACIPQATHRTDSMLFHKERLWNLGAQLCNSKKIIFLDADLVFKQHDWLERCCALLDQFDVIQPFHQAIWLDKDGRPDMHRESVASAIGCKTIPKLQPYHAGFGWGMTRKVFDELGGFYDACVSGNSDSLFALSLRDNCAHKALETYFARRQDSTIKCQSYLRYKEKACSLNLGVSSPSGTQVVHMWHGHRKDRQYVTRTPLFPRREDGEFAVHDSATGLQEWDKIKISNHSTKNYFVGKRDDG